MDYQLNITNVRTATYPDDFPLEDQSNDKLEKVITIIDFDYIGTEDGKEYKVSDSRGVANPVKDSFTDFSSLSKSQVEAWLGAYITNVDYRTMQKQIQKQVPVADSEPTLPW
tara:strand:- start:46 stop:381 length:336 start_codon:yes stop_codon:yes gene_type:complete